MRLSGVRVNDIVRLGDDYHCFVLERGPGWLRVRAICGGKAHAARRVSARDVTGHWARRDRTPPTSGPRA